MNIRFIKNPFHRSNWVLYPYLCTGAYPSPDDFADLLNLGFSVFVDLCDHKVEKITWEYSILCKDLTYINIPIPDGRIISNLKVTDLVMKIESFIKEKKKVYVNCRGGHGRSGTIIACLLQVLLDLTPEESLLRTFHLHQTRKYGREYNSPCSKSQISQVLSFKKPLRVIICGDRNSGQSFRNIIFTEIKKLPPYSTIIQGGCRGIDLTAKGIAIELGYKVEQYDPDWGHYQKAAGPIRNEQMLDSGADLVLAFHPDIKYSSGTKNMIDQAHSRGIKVIIHDMKSFHEFTGKI